jgi:hypothetical protein
MGESAVTRVQPFRNNPSRALVALLATAVAGCGGGGGGGGSSPPVEPTNPATASLTFVIPPVAAAQSGARRPAYISPYTTAITVVIDNVNGSTTVPPAYAKTTTVQLTSGSGGNCSAATATGETCTVQVPAPAGAIVYTFTILNSKGQALATATKLLTIVKGQANSLSVVLSGIVASVKLGVPALVGGVKSSGTVTVDAYDASGGLIDASAPYAEPIVLTDTDKTLSTHLEVNNGIGPTATVSTAGEVVTFTYTGNPDVPAFAITATVNQAQLLSVPLSVASQLISFSNTTVDTLAPSDINYDSPTIYFGVVGTDSAPVTATTTAIESGYSGTFAAVLDPTTCTSADGGPVTAITGSPATTFTVYSLNPGICRVTVTDTAQHSSIFWVSVTTGTVGVDARTHHTVK